MLMDNLSFLLESWNVRGLGDHDKCVSISADISSAKPNILALQETKLDHIASSKASSFLPSSLRDFHAVDADGSSGGLLTAWDANLFVCSASTSSRHLLSLDLSLTVVNSSFRFTNVYAPCDRSAKADFLIDLASHDPGDSRPWIIAGDFNLTRDPADRNNDNFSAAEASMFNDSINSLCLIELPLSDRKFT
jgi:exonuclease III